MVPAPPLRNGPFLLDFIRGFDELRERRNGAKKLTPEARRTSTEPAHRTAVEAARRGAQNGTSACDGRRFGRGGMTRGRGLCGAVAFAFAYKREDLGCRLGDVASGSEYCGDAGGVEEFVVGGGDDAADYDDDVLAALGV